MTAGKPASRAVDAKAATRWPHTASASICAPMPGSCAIQAKHHFSSGDEFAARGEFDRAVECYLAGLTMVSEDAEAWSNLGCVLWMMRRLNRATSCFKRALAIRPAYAEAHTNLGGVLEELGRTQEAITHFQAAIETKPSANAHSRLAHAYLLLGFLNDAIRHYYRALEIDPSDADSFSNLGAALQGGAHTTQAEFCFRRALEIKPDHSKALANLGDIMRLQGDVERAVDAYRSAIAAAPRNWALPIKLALTQPVIVQSSAEVTELRARIAASLETLTSQGAHLEDPNREVGITGFYFAYHGLNDVELQSQIVRFYLRACPRLGWTAPHCPATANARSRIRIGIVSACLRDHTIGKFYRGIIQRLSRERFEVLLFRPRHENDEAGAAIDRSADCVIEIPRDLFAAREQIAAKRLDVVMYPEIGMDPLIYFLAFARLAPVQCVGWGHPVTTGIPTVDYFLSAKALETADANAHYTEQLIRLNRLPTYYSRPRQAPAPLSRAQFGFSPNATLYLSPQSLFKFHPEFDIALATLLRRDPNSRILLIAGIHPHWNKLLARRIANAFPDVANRVVFVPRVGQNEFFRLLLMADVLLDPPYFGGGNTTYEALAAGLPIVTWPGRFMRGRVTQACYQQMGFRQLVAGSLGQYVEIATRLANDAAWKAQVRAEIHERRGVLYEDNSAVTELEDFFTAAVQANRRGEKISAWETR